MKFAFVITNLAGGGAERAVLNIAGALAAKGHDVHLLLLERVMAYTVPAGIEVAVLDRRTRERAAVAAAKSLRDTRRPFRQAEASRRFARCLGAGRCAASPGVAHS